MRIIAFGECMIEITGTLGGPARIAYAGDSFNTALFMTRLGRTVAYASALGDDDWSLALRAAWARDGIDTALVLTAPGKAPGLYAVSTDDTGERSFAYWRGDSAVRQFFRLPGAAAALATMAIADLFYVSGISLSLFDDGERAQLRAIGEAVRARGGQVAFDPNYRPIGWASANAARDAIAAFSAVVSIALPSVDDEALLHGDTSPDATAQRWLAGGVEEVVVKCGASGALVATADVRTMVPATVATPVVDTTGAGDSFNAAYLVARLAGIDPAAAARSGTALAARVVGVPGAILPADIDLTFERGSFA